MMVDSTAPSTCQPDGAAPCTVNVQLVYALSAGYLSIAMQVASGSTVATAIGAAQSHPDWVGVEVDPARIAVFGRLVLPSTELRDGDRVEILRPLSADPKQSRRERALGAQASRG